MAPRETLELYIRLLGLDRSMLPGMWRDLRAIMRDLYASELQLLPDATDVVAWLREQVPLAVASNTDRDLVLFALSAAGFDGGFAVVVSADEVERSKPAPDVYLEACRRLDVHPSAALALEDSPSGVASAKAAGLTVIAAPLLDDVDVSSADFVIPSLVWLLPAAGDRA